MWAQKYQSFVYSHLDEKQQKIASSSEMNEEELNITFRGDKGCTFWGLDGEIPGIQGDRPLKKKDPEGPMVIQINSAVKKRRKNVKGRLYWRGKSSDISSPQ